jgi:hypothetical protein
MRLQKGKNWQKIRLFLPPAENPEQPPGMNDRQTSRWNQDVFQLSPIPTLIYQPPSM